MVAKSIPAALDIPEADWAEAVRREAQIRPLIAGPTSRADIGVAAAALDLSVSQVYRLLGRLREKPLTQSLVVGRTGPKQGTRLLPDEIDRRIENAIDVIHKKREKPSVGKLVRDIQVDCRSAALKPPSRKAVQARLSKRSLKELTQAREGAEAARQRFTPVKPGLRPKRPLAIVQIDHTRVDIQLVDEQSRLVLGRPWLTVMLDVFSRTVLGFYLSFDAPSAAGVALAIAQGVLPKTEWLTERQLTLAWPMQGLPVSIHLDNGSEFHSRALKRGCQQHGIRIDYRPPATPRFGGHIERLMGTLMKRVHALPGSTFSNTVERGKYVSEKRAVLTLGEFERVFALEVLGPYHNEVHATLGKSPAAAWADVGAGEDRARVPDEPISFVLDFLPFEERVVRREGIRLYNVLYFDGALAPLLDRADRRCRIKYDPHSMEAVFVELPGGGHLRVPCADLGRPAISLWEQRTATRALRSAGRRSVDEAAVATAVEEQRRVLAEAHTTSKAARRMAARSPAHRSTSEFSRSPQAAEAADSEAEARIPSVIIGDAWKTEFLR
jgi:putative transposase